MGARRSRQALEETSQCNVADTVRILWIMCSLTMIKKSRADLGDEATTLLTIKQAWGDPHGYLATWSTNTAADICSAWEGVSCNTGLSTVTNLTLSNLGVTGPIPSELSQLPNLIRLDLGFNSLNGSIPDILGNLSKLEYLSLVYNSLRGSIPSTLGNLTSLTFIDLGANMLTGSIPETLGNLSDLQYLSFALNFGLAGSIPSTLWDLSALTYINLCCNMFTGSIPDILGKFTKLEKLDLSANMLTGSFPETLGNLSELQFLSLGSNFGLAGSIPSTLWDLSALTYLSLGANMFTGSIPETLENLSKLQILDLSRNNLTGSIPSTLGNLSTLTYLDLSRNNLSRSIPSEVGKLANLDTLSLSVNALSGSIPNTMGNLNALTYLNTSSNHLEGSIPDWLGILPYLQDLNLSFNLELVGFIPATFGNLTSLQSLDVRSNKLTGPIPDSIGDLQNLMQLYLSDNMLAGSIPSKLGNSTNLTTIDVSSNKLTGPIPDSIGDLQNLMQLYLSDNMLAGSIPSELGNSTNLTTIDLDRNLLTGEIPDSILSAAGRVVNVAENCLNGTSPYSVADRNRVQLTDDNNCFSGTGTECNSKCGFNPTSKRKGNKRTLGISIGVGLVAGLLLVVSVLVFVVRQKRHRYRQHLRASTSISVTRTYEVPGSVQQYTLQQVIDATQNLTTKIGEGGFSTVYKAEFRNGNVAAVKHFNKKKPQENFEQEVVFLAHLNHRYLVNLVGYCDEQGELMLLYDFMNRGSLFESLHDLSSKNHLTWYERVKILLNIARGIDYLHNGTASPLIHRDIKSANILLSISDGKILNAKLADFGLSKQTNLLESYEIMPGVFGTDENAPQAPPTGVAGTPGYIDPEYLVGSEVSPKSDVFSYGVVLLELVTGRPAIFVHDQDRTSLVTWAKPYLKANQISTIVDPRLGNESIPETELMSMQALIRQCIEYDSRNRPTIRGVLKTLSEIFHQDSQPRLLDSEFSRSSDGSTDVHMRNYFHGLIGSDSFSWKSASTDPKSFFGISSGQSSQIVSQLSGDEYWTADMQKSCECKPEELPL